MIRKTTSFEIHTIHVYINAYSTKRQRNISFENVTIYEMSKQATQARLIEKERSKNYPSIIMINFSTLSQSAPLFHVPKALPPTPLEFLEAIHDSYSEVSFRARKLIRREEITQSVWNCFGKVLCTAAFPPFVLLFIYLFIIYLDSSVLDRVTATALGATTRACTSPSLHER